MMLGKFEAKSLWEKWEGPSENILYWDGIYFKRGCAFCQSNKEQFYIKYNCT